MMSNEAGRAGRLAGKVALVTGGASGMGLATVERFVAEGARVVFCDLDPEMGRAIHETIGSAAAELHHRRRTVGGENDGAAIAMRLGGAVRFVAADVAAEASFARAFEIADADFGGLDILVNNAGIGGGRFPIETISEAMFDRTIAVNLKAVWLGMKLAMPLMRRRGGGSIVTTASISGILAMPGQAAYNASKAGALGLVRAAAIEGAPDFIRSNAVNPGGVVTPLVYDNPLVEKGAGREEAEGRLSRVHPIPRAGRPDDIANAILWLASDESSYVTGQSITVDGGQTIEFDSSYRPA